MAPSTWEIDRRAPPQDRAPAYGVLRVALSLHLARLRRCVLQFFQRACLDSDRCRLGIKPALFTRERILAKAALLRRHLLHADLQQTGQRELTCAFLVDRAQNGVFLLMFATTASRDHRCC